MIQLLARVLALLMLTVNCTSQPNPKPEQVCPANLKGPFDVECNANIQENSTNGVVNCLLKLPGSDNMIGAVMSSVSVGLGGWYAMAYTALLLGGDFRINFSGLGFGSPEFAQASLTGVYVDAPDNSTYNDCGISNYKSFRNTYTTAYGPWGNFTLLGTGNFK